MPLVFKEVDEAKISKAKADIKSIQTAIMMFYKDTKKWPIYVNEGGELRDNVTLLISDGNEPRAIEENCDTRVKSNLKDHLSRQLSKALYLSIKFFHKHLLQFI